MTPRSAWLKSLRRQLLKGLSVRRRNLRRRQSGLATSVELLESRALLAVTLVPEPAGGTEGLPGHVVEFRKGPAGSITPGDTLASADALFALPVANAGVIADATDNGVAVINYLDAENNNVFPLPRDVGIPPLTGVKVTGAAGGANSGTFNPLAQDAEFAMKSSGFIDIPTAGDWTFSVRSDDGERLLIGNDHAVVTIFDGPRGAATDSTTVTVPRPGLYQYQLTWVNGTGGAVGEFFAQGPSDPSPVLVGDTANGGLAVFETYDAPLTITGQTIDATEGATFSGTVATFTDSDLLAVVGIFSATINWGDGTTTAG
ncbi:MAG TPA: hypothetical protein VNM37_28120, partial [Candidatus Dormibacteraeota bacterium]|nr:hypothetical protein [Candidatus Dormibacteraeota bacterium]